MKTTSLQFNAYQNTTKTEVLESQLEPLKQLIQTPNLTELMVNPDGSVWTERAGRLVKTSIKLNTQLRLSVIRELAGFYDLVCNRDSPTLACRLPVFEAGRVQAVIPPISTGPMLSIRFPSRSKLALKHLIKYGSLTKEQAEELKSYVRSKKNILISGGTGSGKTTLANALLDIIKDERIVVIEDTPEISLRNENTLYWQTTPAFTSRDAVLTSLRVRPDRIILGEIRHGGDAQEWCKAALTGHPGSLATTHADSAAGARQRIRSLIQEVVVSPSDDLIDSAIDVSVFVSKRVEPATKKIIRKVEEIRLSKNFQTTLKERVA